MEWIRSKCYEKIRLVKENGEWCYYMIETSWFALLYLSRLSMTGRSRMETRQDKCLKNVDLNKATRMTEEKDLGESIYVAVNWSSGSRVSIKCRQTQLLIFVLLKDVLWIFRNVGFHGEALLAPRATPKLKDHPLSAVRDCLFNIFAATLHIGGRSSIRNLRTRHAVVTGTHLSWPMSYRGIYI
jgi:hypothetical protein